MFSVISSVLVLSLDDVENIKVNSYWSFWEISEFDFNATFQKRISEVDRVASIKSASTPPILKIN